MAYLGRGSYVGIGEETTWGTAVAASHFRPLISSSLTRTVSQLPRTDLHSASGSAMRRSHFQESEEVSGSFSVLATYTGNIGLLLKHALGAAATTSTGGSPAYQHDYTLAAALPAGLSIENIRGTSGNSEKFEGCKINTLSLDVSAGSEMTCNFDIIGETAAARASASTVSVASTESVVLHHQAGQFSFNSANYDLSSLSLTVNNNLDRRMLLGSKLTAEPTRSDFQEVTLSVELESTDALYVALTASTTSDASITFTDSSSRTFTITLHNAYLSEFTDSIDGAGIVTASATFVGESDGTDEGLLIRVVNGANAPAQEE